jgi:dihydroorotate dehydrogenase
VIYQWCRSLLFCLDPETAHHLALAAIARVGQLPPARAAVASLFSSPEARPVDAFGLRFPNRVGLAAGYDKDGEGWRGLATLGFGHIEVGTVTPQPQPGNLRPRVFRLTSHSSLINRMGFPGKGAVHVRKHLAGPRPGGLIVGVNIGKQKTTPLEDAARDYEELMEVFAPVADYLAVNISSPNTPGLRRLQERGFLESLLGAVAVRRSDLADRSGKRVPVLVKLAPDLSDAQLSTAVETIIASGLDGIIATNTTVSRNGIDHPLAGQEGGLSGAALSARSTEIVRKIAEMTNGRIPIVGVGGIMGPDDAQAKLDAGATLIQVYTGLVYEGPGLVKRILRTIG